MTSPRPPRSVDSPSCALPHRRDFLRTSLAGTSLLATGLAPRVALAAADEKQQKLPVAAIVTIYRRNSHADVLVGKIVEGWNQDGGAGPQLELVSLFTDQVPKNDKSRELAAAHGFKIADSIDEALTLGGDKLAVSGVLLVGEHGDYPVNDLGQGQFAPFDGSATVGEAVGQQAGQGRAGDARGLGVEDQEGRLFREKFST